MVADVLQVLFKRKPVQFLQTPPVDDDSAEVSVLYISQCYTIMHILHAAFIDQ